MATTEIPPEPSLPPEQQWPGVDLAYEYVRPSYDFLAQRLEAIEARVRTLMAFSAATTFAAPAFARAILDPRPLDYQSGWFLVALGLFALTLILGALIHLWGTFRVIDPTVIYSKYIHMTPWNFKHAALYWAVKDFATNRRLVNVKGHLANIVAACLLIEVCCLVVWVTYQSG